MKERPTYTKWRRRMGGFKECRKCGHKHPAVMRLNGQVVRPKECLRCGTPLPSRLRFPKKAAVRWYVREFDPVTGQSQDLVCCSSEDADELIRRRRRDYTADPVREQLLEQVSLQVRQIEAASLDDAVNQLITKLGGDPIKRALKPIGWDEAREMIADELRQKGLSALYVEEMLRVTADLGIITGLTEWPRVDLDAVAKYRSARMKGGWERNGRKIAPVGGRAINKDLGTLSAYFTRAVRKGWIARNPLENAPDEKVKVPAVRVEYMPDEDLRALIEVIDTTWVRTFVIVAYYTGARRGDLLRLEWEKDIDLDGTKVASEGRSGPHIYIRGSKADTPHWMPLHPAAVQALQGLRCEPVISALVFPVRATTNRASRVSHLFASFCIKAGLTEQVEHKGKTVLKNKWSLHDLRRKANTDLRNRGASAKERAALLGHRTTAVNELHYEALIPSRERELVDGLPVFGRTA